MEGARSERAPKGRWKGQEVLGAAISKVSSFLKFANSQIPFPQVSKWVLILLSSGLTWSVCPVA